MRSKYSSLMVTHHSPSLGASRAFPMLTPRASARTAANTSGKAAGPGVALGVAGMGMAVSVGMGVGEFDTGRTAQAASKKRLARGGVRQRNKIGSCQLSLPLF